MTTRKILIIDDIIRNAKVTELLIEELASSLLNFKVDISIATKYAEAKVIAKNFNPDFIFCDVNLDKGLLGIELMNEMRNSKIISYLTQCCYYTSKPDTEKLLPHINKGKDFVLTKPSPNNSLQAVLVEMNERRAKMNLRNLLLINEDILPHDLVFLSFENKICNAKLISSIKMTDHKFRSLQTGVSFSQALKNLEFYDFFIQIHKYRLINKWYVSDVSKLIQHKNTYIDFVLEHNDSVEIVRSSESFHREIKQQFSIRDKQ